MTDLAGKTYWLIGASEGLGRALALALDKSGARLIVSARSEDRLDSLVSELSNARALVLDVTDAASVQSAADRIEALDGVIYNVGGYDPLPSEDWDSDAILSMMDVNYSGAVRVLGHVVPRFLAKRAGDITLVGSLAGYRGLPAALGYGPSKAALISMAETMRHDLKGSGVTLRVVNPGFIRTRLTDKNDFKMPQLMEPEEAAAHVLKAMQSRRFRTDFPRPFSLFIKLLHLLPDLLVYRSR